MNNKFKITKKNGGYKKLINNKKISERTSRKTNKRTSCKTNKRTSRKTNKRTSRKINKRTSRKTNKRTSRKTNKRTSRKTNKRTSRKINKRNSKYLLRGGRGGRGGIVKLPKIRKKMFFRSNKGKYNVQQAQAKNPKIKIKVLKDTARKYNKPSPYPKNVDLGFNHNKLTQSNIKQIPGVGMQVSTAQLPAAAQPAAPQRLDLSTTTKPLLTEQGKNKRNRKEMMARIKALRENTKSLLDEKK